MIFEKKKTFGEKITTRKKNQTTRNIAGNKTWEQAWYYTVFTEVEMSGSEAQRMRQAYSERWQHKIWIEKPCTLLRGTCRTFFFSLR